MTSVSKQICDVVTTPHCFILIDHVTQIRLSDWLEAKPTPFTITEEQALATSKRTPPLWLRYVNDTFTAVHKDEMDDFHHFLTDRTLTYSIQRRPRKMPGHP